MKPFADRFLRFYDRLLNEKWPELNGSLDAFEADRFLSGWAQDQHNPNVHVQIIVELNAEPIATGLANLARSDGLPGYRIDTNGLVSLMDIADHRIRVIALAKDGSRAELGRHYPFIRTVMKRLFQPIQVTPPDACPSN